MSHHTKRVIPGGLNNNEINDFRETQEVIFVILAW